MTNKEQIEIMAKIIDDEKDVCVRIHGLMDCKDCTCKDKNGNCGFGDYIARTLFMENCRMRTTEKNSGVQWHKVADGDLPKEKQNVLIAFKGFQTNKIVVISGFYLKGDFMNENSSKIRKDHVIAWTELPKYKE